MTKKFVLWQHLYEIKESCFQWLGNHLSPSDDLIARSNAYIFPRIDTSPLSVTTISQNDVFWNVIKYFDDVKRRNMKGKGEQRVKIVTNEKETRSQCTHLFEGERKIFSSFSDFPVGFSLISLKIQNLARISLSLYRFSHRMISFVLTQSIKRLKWMRYWDFPTDTEKQMEKFIVTNERERDRDFLSKFIQLSHDIFYLVSITVFHRKFSPEFSISNSLEVTNFHEKSLISIVSFANEVFQVTDRRWYWIVRRENTKENLSPNRFYVDSINFAVSLFLN